MGEACSMDRKDAYKIWSQNLKGTDHLNDLRVDGNVSEWISGK
jgi:hypothetical protein